MKVFALIIFLTFVSFASESSNELRVKILEKVIAEVDADKENLIWSDNKQICNSLKERKTLQTTKNCESATIIILENKNNLKQSCVSKNIFVLSYELLSDVPKSFGALFWKKGRPNIVIIKPRIQKQSIEISNNLAPYLEDKVW